MKLLTHMTIAILVLSILTLYGILIPDSVFSLILGLIVLCVGAMLPDLDLELDRMFPHYIEREIELEDGTKEIKRIPTLRYHRRLLHNYVIVALLFIASYLLYYFYPIIFPYFLIFTIGYSTHIISDTFTRGGVSIYGGKRKIRGVIRVSAETDLLVIFILSIILYFLIIIRMYLIL